MEAIPTSHKSMGAPTAHKNFELLSYGETKILIRKRGHLDYQRLINAPLFWPWAGGWLTVVVRVWEVSN